jgi:hypothetical protein
MILRDATIYYMNYWLQLLILLFYSSMKVLYLRKPDGKGCYLLVMLPV